LDAVAKPLPAHDRRGRARLHTAALESWALRYKTIADFLGMPKELMLFCGMALGQIDPAPTVNRVRVGRAPLSGFATLSGFESRLTSNAETRLKPAEIPA
jgi:hypothetical protein